MQNFHFAGDYLKLEVEVDGKPDVNWYYDGKKFVSNEFIKITTRGKIHTLEIKECVPEDEGQSQDDIFSNLELTVLFIRIGDYKKVSASITFNFKLNFFLVSNIQNNVKILFWNKV